jgi:glycosyltransferase involved in cell wall biosynthesis
MRKKVLIISYSYPPANVPAAQRPYSLAKYLDKTKYKVKVLTCANPDSSLGFDQSMNTDIEDVEVVKVKSAFNLNSQREVKKSTMHTEDKIGFNQKIKIKLFNLGTKLIFPDKVVTWLPTLFPYLLFFRKKFKADIIFSTSPSFTNHLVALFLQFINPKAKHVADFRDFHYTSNHELKKGIKPFLHKLLERKILKKANVITFISTCMKDIYASKYEKYQSKFNVVYNGYEENPYADEGQLNDNKLSVFYAGSFYGGVRSPKPLLFALEHLIKEGGIENKDLEIAIAGNIENDLILEINNMKVFKSFQFLGLIPRNDVLKKYCNSHLLWLIVGNEIHHYSGVPIKMFEYIAAGRYILNFAPKESESNNLINISKAGFNFENENFSEHNIEELRKIIMQYKEGKLSEKLNTNSLSFYRRENQITHLETLF